MDVEKVYAQLDHVLAKKILNNKDVHGGAYESSDDEGLLDPDMALDI